MLQRPRYEAPFGKCPAGNEEIARIVVNLGNQRLGEPYFGRFRIEGYNTNDAHPASNQTINVGYHSATQPCRDGPGHAPDLRGRCHSSTAMQLRMLQFDEG